MHAPVPVLPDPGIAAAGQVDQGRRALAAMQIDQAIACFESTLLANPEAIELYKDLPELRV